MAEWGWGIHLTWGMFLDLCFEFDSHTGFITRGPYYPTRGIFPGKDPYFFREGGAPTFGDHGVLNGVFSESNRKTPLGVWGDPREEFITGTFRPACEHREECVAPLGEDHYQPWVVKHTRMRAGVPAALLRHHRGVFH